MPDRDPDPTAYLEITQPMEEGVGHERGADHDGSATSMQSETRPSVVVPLQAEDIDLDDPSLYLNRELTWLNFNWRVLFEAADPRTPLLERLKFIAIVSSNLDEFFMKRIGGLKQQVGAGVRQLTIDGRTPQQQIDECCAEVQVLETVKADVYTQVRALLADQNIIIANYADCSPQDQDYLREYFVNEIFPLVTPQAVDSAHPFPFISNLSMNLLVTLQHQDDDDVLMARVKVPSGNGIKRFIEVEDESRFVHMADVIAHNLDLIFPGLTVIACEAFHVTRNANTERDEDSAEDLLAMIASEVRDRKFAPIVRIVVDADMDERRRKLLARECGLNADKDVFVAEGLPNLVDLMEIACLDVPALRDPDYVPIDNTSLDGDQDVFRTIADHGSILLQHPYESFGSSVERFLKEASRDEHTLAIKMTLYRTSRGTKVIDYLIDAAQNGKQVAVVVELKARFDEAQNILWANRLEEAGIHVTYGVVGLKTHCKVILVVRREAQGMCRYTHIGTGNYHAGTARLYSDFGLLTDDETIGRDVSELFNYLTTGYTAERNYKKLITAPNRLKDELIHRIRREVQHVRRGGSGRIQFKMNALEDPDITRELYKASRAGVRVDLIIRDTCRLRPGLRGLSENVRVISIVGRFLEHARLFYFANNGVDDYLLGSADAMQRNLKNRVEVVCPVTDARLKRSLRTFLDVQLSDKRGAWDMRQDGSYVQRHGKQGDAVHSQDTLMAMAKDRQRLAERNKRSHARSLLGRTR